MLNLATIAPWLQKEGVYGPVTATLDWCEINYQFSPYIAEMANAFSNLFSVGLAFFGYLSVIRQSLPTRFKTGYMGVALVGIGSFFFHATLLFEAQLADELPMIYVASMSIFLLFDNKPGFTLNNPRSLLLIAVLVLFDVLFTWSYIVNRNPVYHQVVFASLIVLATLRIFYILRMTEAAKRIPGFKKSIIARSFSTGAALFALGFFFWNLDNIFCQNLTEWKVVLGWPVAFVLEGHSWWHVLTGLGAYFMFVGIQFITLCIKDHPKHYAVDYCFGLPSVRKVTQMEK